MVQKYKDPLLQAFALIARRSRWVLYSRFVIPFTSQSLTLRIIDFFSRGPPSLSGIDSLRRKPIVLRPRESLSSPWASKPFRMVGRGLVRLFKSPFPASFLPEHPLPFGVSLQRLALQFVGVLPLNGP